MVQSRFLKQADFPKPGLLTIARFENLNVARDNEPKEMKWVVYFKEVEQGMVLSPVNLQLIKIATGTNNPDTAIGKKIVIFVDPTVMMGTKVTGGLRIRAPKNQVVAAPAPAEEEFTPEPPAEMDEEETDVPF